jgi:hypothetical protein
VTTAPAGPALTAVAGLSCYTANLTGYLAGERPDAADHVARSVRLAVGTDRADGVLAFSHHRIPLHVLSDGSLLRFTGAPDAKTALVGVAQEIAAYGRVLVVGNTATMDWSAARDAAGAPRLVLVDGHAAGRWHIRDEFRARLPTGEQRPFAGWVSTAALRRGLTPLSQPSPAHRLRNEYAFGFPVELPPPEWYQWLVRTAPTGAPPPARLPGRWVTAIDEVLTVLEDFWAALADRPERVEQLDDMWAAAQHHAFRYTRAKAPTGAAGAVLDEAARAWQDLPMALHFAAASARRGRPRPQLVRLTFDRLRRVERAVGAFVPPAFAGVDRPATQRRPAG